MSEHAPHVRRLLSRTPLTSRDLVEVLGISQPTVSRALRALDAELVRIGSGRSIHYALRDTSRGLPEITVDRVGSDGRVRRLGRLIPVRAQGFVMQPLEGPPQRHEGLPWWLMDMRPQGFLGRAFAARHATALSLPPRLSEWDDTHVLRALAAHGHDAVGNLLLGETALHEFLHAPDPEPIALAAAAQAYERLAAEASRGEMPGSSAGGEQPKFTAYVETTQGPRHVLVKFTLPEANPVTQRWRDLLLAEHHALETLRAAGQAAAASRIVEGKRQRFLEIERFDRVGIRGRRALLSLAALEAEFVGNAPAAWPVLVGQLADLGHVTARSADEAASLYAFGTLIGNTDMHHGNLSFSGEAGRPWALAPAYDMLPMGFAPQSSGALHERLPTARLHPAVGAPAWQGALALAHDYLARLRSERRFSQSFRGCREALTQHLADASERIARLG